MQYGLSQFSIRKDGSGVPAAYPYVRDPAEALIAKPLWKGTPLALSSGNSVRRAVTSGGIVTEGKILGHSASTDLDPAYGVEFGQMPYQNDSLGRRLVQVYPARASEVFTAALASGVAANINTGVIGTQCTFREQSTDLFVVDPTTSGVNQLIEIIGVHPSDVGLLGGRVDFIYIGAKSSFLNGP